LEIQNDHDHVWVDCFPNCIRNIVVSESRTLFV
jgi:hypothetical protein